MNKFFQSAIKRYNEVFKKEYLISPMSETDSQIIIELGQIIKKAGLTDVCEILKTYKDHKDQDVMESLLNWNIDNPTIKKFEDKPTEEVNPYKQPPLIQIENLMLKMNQIHGVATYERVIDGGFAVYGIIINPTPDHAKQIPLFANYTIEWRAESNRNTVLKRLKDSFVENGSSFINMNEDE